MSRNSRHLAWRRNWWLFAALGVFSATMLLLMGTDLVVPYTASKSLAVQTRAVAATKRAEIARARGLLGTNHTNPVDLFDDTVPHDVTIEIAPADYDRLIADYQQSTVKTWVEATVVVDGERVTRAGVRLKGNSTLIGLKNNGDSSPFAAVLGKLSPDEPQTLPWLVRFDKFLPEQLYQGIDELAIRSTGGFSGDSTQITEHLANRLTELSGQPYLRSSFGGVSINGSKPGYTLLSEIPSRRWSQRMFPGATGALYKAVVAAKFRYVGDDPAAYAKVFTQKTQTRVFDLQPAIAFLKFVEESDDATFAARLGDHLDIDNFVRYLALHNLVVDPDSLAGSGNNYYLMYDATKHRVSFVAWDQNLAFGRMGFVGAKYRTYYEDGFGIPAGLAKIPGLEDLIQGEALGEPNLLVTRFFAVPKLKATYDRVYRELYRDLLASGKAERLLDHYADVVRRVGVNRGLVDPQKFEGDVARSHQFLVDRAAFLRTVAPIAPA